MSKAFDTVKRRILLEDLRSILDKDELHLCKLLIEDVKLCITCGKEKGEYFTTKKGICQGDCLSAIFFIIYLAKALGFRPHLEDHNYSLPEYLRDKEAQHQLEHNYCITKEVIQKVRKESLEIPLQYADDFGYAIVSENQHLMKYNAITITSQLKERNLSCNEEKNEEFHITRKGEVKWQNCKYLGSLLATEKDIKRRKSLTLTAMNDLQNVWNSRLPLNQKLRIFNSCIAPIFLSNAHLWTINQTINGQIDAFQRRLYRYLLNIKYPKKISNLTLQTIIKEQKWSAYLTIQRVRWIGHVYRLPENAPARLALKESDRPTNNPRGRQKTKWLDVMKKQLIEIDIQWDEVPQLARNRKTWDTVITSWKKKLNTDNSV